MRICDAHLDLAYNASLGRDVTKPAREQPTIRDQIATVGLPDLRAGNVDLICATIFCEPKSDLTPNGYTNADQAFAQAQSQLAWYATMFETRELRFSSDGVGIETILLLEGADAIRSPEDVKFFFDAGVRIVGLAWKQTRYAGGTGSRARLSSEGVALVSALDRFGIIHDASHLSEESFWHLLDITTGPIIASHSNCKSIVGGESNRHLTDDMIRAIAQRGGVIGINFFDKFLLPKKEFKKRRATLTDVGAHVKHICDLVGSAKHVGLGTDMDGGLGREQIPIEIKTSADLPRVADALAVAGIDEDDAVQVMGANWRDYLSAHIP